MLLRVLLVCAGLPLFPTAEAMAWDLDQRAVAYVEIPFDGAPVSIGLRVDRTADGAGRPTPGPVAAAPVMDLRAGLAGVYSWKLNGTEIRTNRYVTNAAEKGDHTALWVVLGIGVAVGVGVLIANAVEDNVERCLVDLTNECD